MQEDGRAAKTKEKDMTMTTTETTTTMDRFYELMDFITGGPTSETSLAACDMYAAAIARAETAETEREVWRLRHRAIYNKYDDTRDERESLIARVDELEREYAAALARIAQLEAAAKRYRELTFAAGFYGCPSCEVPLVLPALFPLTDDTELTEEEYDDGPEVETAADTGMTWPSG